MTTCPSCLQIVTPTHLPGAGPFPDQNVCPECYRAMEDRP